MERKTPLRGLLLGLCLLGLIPLLWPADVPWIDDEPALLQRALGSVRYGELAGYGLTGRAGVAYGPAPIAFYALGVVLTKDLVTLVWLRALLVTFSTGAAIYWLARSCRSLNPLIGLLALLSPYLWFYSRLLWDNSFLIPLSALTIAAYVSLCCAPASWKLVFCIGCGTLMFLTHLMALPLLLALSLHLLWRHHTWLKHNLRVTIAALACAAIVSAPYLRHLRTHFHFTRGPVETGFQGWSFALLGGRFFSAQGLEYFLGDSWTHADGPAWATWLDTCKTISMLALPLTWFGIVVGIRRLGAARGQGQPIAGESELTTVALLAIALQTLLNGVSQLFGEPHYYNATWFALFALIWLALSGLGRLGWALAVLSASSQAVLLAYVIGSIHRTQGNQGIHYGPTLGTQIHIMHELRRFDPRSELRNQSSHYRNFPRAFSVLQLFYPVRSAPHAKLARLVIRFEKPGSRSGALVLEERSP